MATPSIDRTLKGLQELRAADPAELEERVAQLEAQQADITFQLYVLRPLVKEAKERRAQEEGGAAAAVARAARDETRDERGQTVEHVEGRPASWKGDAILALFAESPHQTYLPAEVREQLRMRKVMEGDEGTPTSVLLRRLADRGQVARDGNRYGYLPTEDNPFMRDAPIQISWGARDP